MVSDFDATNKIERLGNVGVYIKSNDLAENVTTVKLYLLECIQGPGIYSTRGRERAASS